MPAAQPVALLAAAVEAYAADHAAVEAAFHAGARRGRPEVPDRVGTTAQLRYAGVTYDLAVYRTSPSSYRVRWGNVAADLSVDFVNDFERRVRCAGRFHRVVAVTQGAMFRIVVDGTTHRVTRDDGGVVRAGWPAFVVSLLVQPGDQVVEGDPVAVLESMKMESTVTAPYPGEVVAVDVVPNAQVSTGAPLLRIRATEPRARCRTGRRNPRPHRDGGSARPRRAALRPGVRVAAQLPARLRPRPRHAPPPAGRATTARRDQPARQRGPASLRGRAARPVRRGRSPVPAEDRDPARRRAHRDQHAGVPAGLPAVAGRRPGRAARHLPGEAGVCARPLRRGGAGPEAGAGRRRRVDVPVVQPGRRPRAGRPVDPRAAVARRFRARAAGRRGHARLVSTGWRPRRRAGTRTSPTWPATFASATSTSRCSSRSSPGSTTRPSGSWTPWRPTPTAPGRDAAIARLVRSPHPQRGALLSRWLGTTDTVFRKSLLEVYARRYYRIRELRDLHFFEHDSDLLCVTDYDWENKHIRLVVAYTPAGPATRAGTDGGRASGERADRPARRRGSRDLADRTASARRTRPPRRSTSSWPPATSAANPGGWT